MVWEFEEKVIQLQLETVQKIGEHHKEIRDEVWEISYMQLQVFGKK